MFNFAVVADYGGACAFGLLATLLVAAHRGSLIGRLLITASVISTVWFAAQGAYYASHGPEISLTAIQIGEIIRDAGWFLFVGALLTTGREDAYASRVRWLLGALLCLSVAAAFGVAGPPFLPAETTAPPVRSKALLLIFLVLSIAGLVLIEQLYRNTHPDARWAIKHLCFGVGAIFAYDFFLYADAVLFNRIDPDIWSARGAANAVAVPLIALAAARNRQWDLNLFVSRKVVFHSTAVLGAGLYLLLMALAGYYLKAYGGTWGGALRIAFLFGALLFLVAVLFSAQLRSRLRLFLAKHFYQNKYEYGDVWLNFTRQLSANDTDPTKLRQTILKAIVEIMDTTGGLMWQKDASGNFPLAAAWNMDDNFSKDISGEDRVVRNLELDGSVLEVNPTASEAGDDPEGGLADWLMALPRARLVVPIMHRDELIAFLVLAESRSNAPITWEDRELLRTVGSQAASYLALLRATEALSETRQFEAFNRLSAFLVHDLKNVVAQLSLIVRNSERHRGNPEFISDAFNTIGDSIAKMNRMLASLRQDHASAVQENRIELNGLIEEVITRRREIYPQPIFESTVARVEVLGNRDQVLSVLEHLVQNAQEATPRDGSVVVRLHNTGDRAFIEIADNGSGMDPEFVKNRLFRPFDTTKGKAGMGIGAYESRHIVLSMGGRMSVDSQPEEGTTFRISLPCLDTRPPDETSEIPDENS